jgi:hypothetical protein
VRVGRDRQPSAAPPRVSTECPQCVVMQCREDTRLYFSTHFYFSFRDILMIVLPWHCAALPHARTDTSAHAHTHTHSRSRAHAPAHAHTIPPAHAHTIPPAHAPSRSPTRTGRLCAERYHVAAVKALAWCVHLVDARTRTHANARAHTHTHTGARSSRTRSPAAAARPTGGSLSGTR